MPLRATLLALLLLPAALPAQTIRGRVIEDGTDTPISQATVELLTRDSVVHRTVVSDSAGWFRIEPGEAGRYLLRPSHPSFFTNRMDTVSVQKREIVTLVVRMGRAAIPLEPLVVTARSADRLAGYRERAGRNAFGRFIRREEIDARGSARVTDLLQVTPGVRVVPVSTGGMFPSNLIMMRGGGGQCLANVFVDGFPMRQYAESSVDDMLTADQLEGVEIYSSATTAPAEFMAPMNNCGVVAFWTRRDGGKPFTWRRLFMAAGFVGLVWLLTR